MVMRLHAIPENMDQEYLKSIMDELNSITQCPYPVSLKKLELFLINTDDTALRLWVVNFPCRASILVRKVRDGLKLSTSALVVVERLSRLETFRSLLIEQEPSILPTLIHQALHSETYVEQHLDICTNFLSYPLNGLSLPDGTEEFVSKICDSAVQHPSIRNFARLHRIVRGSCRELLVALPHQALHRLSERVISVVKITKATDKESPILFCISILASLKQASGGNSLEFAVLHHAADEFFHGTKCAKTIQLVLLRTIWACKDSSATPFEGAVGCLRLAREILQSIDLNTLSKWRLDHAPIVRKLIEKISNCHLNSEILCGGATLLNIVLGGQDIPASIIINAEKSILSPNNFGILDEAGFLTVKQVICDFAHLFDQGFFTVMLEKAFAFALGSATRDLYQLKYLLSLLQAFDIIVRENAIVATTAQKSLSSQRLSFLIDKLLKDILSRSEAIYDRNEDFCLQALYESQRQLKSAIISLSLKSSLLVKTGDSKLPVSITQRLVDQQMKLCVPVKQCREHVNSADSNLIHMPLPEKSNVCISEHGADWRELLAADLKVKAAEQARQTVETIERVCRDFENRCESIEEPLRKEEQKSREAQISVRQLEDEVKTLGAEATDRMLYLDGLEAEKSELENRVNETLAQNSSLTGQNEDLRRLLKEAIDEKSHTISVERNERDALYFQYKTKFTALEMEIERLQLEVSSLRSQNKELQAHINEDDTKKSHLNDDIKILRADLISREEELKTLTIKLSEKDNGFKNAEKHALELEDTLSAERNRSKKANEQMRQMKSEYSLSIASLETKLEKASDLQKSSEDNLNRSRRHLEQLEEDRATALTTIKEQEIMIQNIEDTNENLAQELRVKENELAEGQELRIKLFALVGGDKLEVPQIKSPEDLLSRKVLPRRTRSDVVQTSESIGLLQSSGSSGSSSRKSPTPKRMRKVFKVPTMKQPHFSPNKHLSKPKRVRKSDATRSPLSNASPGRYNLTTYPAEPRSPNGKNEAIKPPFSPVRTLTSPSITTKTNRDVHTVNLNGCKEQLESDQSSAISSTLNLLRSPRHECVEADDTTIGF